MNAILKFDFQKQNKTKQNKNNYVFLKETI